MPFQAGGDVSVKWFYCFQKGVGPLRCSKRRADQDHNIPPDKEHAHFSCLFLNDLLVGLLVNFSTRDGLLHFPQNHIEMLVVGLLKKQRKKLSEKSQEKAYLGG